MKAWHTSLRSIGITAVSLCAIAWGSAWAQGIETTPHNLSSTGPGPNTFSGTQEICVFCHTPHAGDTSAEVPLWNRTLAASTTYTTYSTSNSSSIDGQVAEVGSVSIACLSCHDGTQAMNTVINAPGSGLTAAPTSPWATGTWTGADRPQGVANIGQDLTNDHPIGIQYAGGGIAVGSNTPNDPDFNLPQNQLINGTTVWWVDTETTPNLTRNKSDMQLYTRDITAIAGGPQPFVECASCHDPHNGTNPTFLRIANDGSAVCLACHNK